MAISEKNLFPWRKLSFVNRKKSEKSFTKNRPPNETNGNSTWEDSKRHTWTLSTSHVEFANLTREVCNRPLWSWQTLYKEIGPKTRSVLQSDTWWLHFLCFVRQKATSQTTIHKGKRDLSPYFAFRVGKCHRSKNNAPESVRPERKFTKSKMKSEEWKIKNGEWRMKKGRLKN